MEIANAMDHVEAVINNPGRFEHWLTTTGDAALSLLTDYSLRLLGALVILAVGWFFALQVRRALLSAGRRSSRVDLTVIVFLSSLAKYVIIAFTVVAVLASIGVQTTSLVAAFGAAGIAIGLALQGTLSHFAAGIMLVLFRPFRVGDMIETANVSGTVREINLFTTEITNLDNVRIIIPNNAVWTGVTKNFSTYDRRRLDLEVALPFWADTTAVLEVLRRVVAAEPRVMQHPEPVIGVSKFTDATIRVAIQAWVPTNQVPAVELALGTAVTAELQKGGHLAR
jgi:small conductance mechanosensitive channel